MAREARQLLASNGVDPDDASTEALAGAIAQVDFRRMVVKFFEGMSSGAEKRNG